MLKFELNCSCAAFLRYCQIREAGEMLPAVFGIMLTASIYVCYLCYTLDVLGFIGKSF